MLKDIVHYVDQEGQKRDIYFDDRAETIRALAEVGKYEAYIDIPIGPFIEAVGKRKMLAKLSTFR